MEIKADPKQKENKPKSKDKLEMLKDKEPVERKDFKTNEESEEKRKEYKAERDLYEENIDKLFGKELADQTNNMMEAHKESLNIHKEIEHKQEQNMMHQILNSLITFLLSMITFTMIFAIYMIRRKLGTTLTKRKEIMTSFKNLNSVISQKPKHKKIYIDGKDGGPE